MSKYWSDFAKRHVTADALAKLVATAAVRKQFGKESRTRDVSATCERSGYDYSFVVTGIATHSRHRAAFTCYCSIALQNNKTWRITETPTLSTELGRHIQRSRQAANRTIGNQIPIPALNF